jgi:hypothetical protein
VPPRGTKRKIRGWDSDPQPRIWVYRKMRLQLSPWISHLAGAASLLATAFGVSPSPTCLSADWRRNRTLCVNGLIHGHLCVCGFGRCRRIAHRYTFICQESVRNLGHRSPQIAGMDAPSRQPRRTSGRDGPDQRGSSLLMSIHRSHLCHIGGVDQAHFLIRPEIPGSPGFRRATQNRPTTALRRMAILAVSEGGLPA